MVPITTKAEKHYELLVSAADSNGQRVQIVFTRLVRRSLTSLDRLLGPDELDYDSDKRTTGAPASAQARVRAIVGMALTATIGTDGNIRDTAGIAEVIAKVGASKDSAGAHTIDAMCQELLRDAITPLLFPFPGAPLAKGYAWTRENTTPFGIGAEIRTTEERKVASIGETPEGRVAEITLVVKNPSNSLWAYNMYTGKTTKDDKIESLGRDISGKVMVNLRTKMVTYSGLHHKCSIQGPILGDGKRSPDMIEEGDSEVRVTSSRADGK